jgi:hypothetical protein
VVLPFSAYRRCFPVEVVVLARNRRLYASWGVVVRVFQVVADDFFGFSFSSVVFPFFWLW